jgi:hypothetical protein
VSNLCFDFRTTTRRMLNFHHKLSDRSWNKYILNFYLGQALYWNSIFVIDKQKKAIVLLDTYIMTQTQNINISKHPFRPIPPKNQYINTIIHQCKYKMFYTIYLYICILIHVSGPLISLWWRANPLFVPHKYVTPTGKQLHADYVQNGNTYNKYHLTLQLVVNNRYAWFSI